MDKRLLTVILMAVFVALVITAVFYQITVGRTNVATAPETRALVVAKKELPMGSVITDQDVNLVLFPTDVYPAGGFGDIDEVVDRAVVQSILPNEPVIAGRVTEKGAGYGLAPLIPEGQRAMAIAVNQVSGVSGFILPGSNVDILLTGTPDNSGGDRMTTTVLENVTVLSTGHRQQPNANGQPENVPVVNVLVTPEQAEMLTLATDAGKIQLVLRNPVDEKETSKERPAVRASDLYAKRDRRPVAAAPGPRRPTVVVQAAPPPPPPVTHTVEMIRGDQRSEVVLGGGNAAKN
jgi:pilus assembly protein CpaB